jgi:hypothetical protein
MIRNPPSWLELQWGWVHSRWGAFPQILLSPGVGEVLSPCPAGALFRISPVRILIPYFLISSCPHSLFLISLFPHSVFPYSLFPPSPIPAFPQSLSLISSFSIPHIVIPYLSIPCFVIRYSLFVIPYPFKCKWIHLHCVYCLFISLHCNLLFPLTVIFHLTWISFEKSFPSNWSTRLTQAEVTVLLDFHLLCMWPSWCLTNDLTGHTSIVFPDFDFGHNFQVWYLMSLGLEVCILGPTSCWVLISLVFNFSTCATWIISFKWLGFFIALGFKSAIPL